MSSETSTLPIQRIEMLGILQIGSMLASSTPEQADRVVVDFCGKPKEADLFF